MKPSFTAYIKSQFNPPIYFNNSRSLYPRQVFSVLFCAILLVLFRPVSTFAQTNTVLDQKISIQLDHTNLTDALKTIGERADNGNDPAYTFNQGAWTPKLGLVYEVLPKQLSVFGNYMGGIKNLNSFLANDGTGGGRLQKADPEKARQWEAGIKSSLIDDKLSLMASYFNIKVDNKLRIDPSNTLYSLQDGTQANKGVELELFVNPVRGLDIMAGYAYLDAKFLNGTDEGKRPAYAPKSTVNYWLSYTFLQGAVKGFGLGIGGNYRGNSFVTSANTILNPEVHTMNATVDQVQKLWGSVKIFSFGL